MVQLFRQAPNKWQLLRSLALGGKGGNPTTTSEDGTVLSVRQTGKGDPLVLVHGSLDGIGAFSLVELRLAEDHSVWVYDRRGRGGSGDGAEYSLDREVDDLRAVITATGGVPHVVAHSYGAVIALQARLRGVPMRSLVVYEPAINGEAIDPQQIASIRLAVEEGRIDDAIRDMANRLAGITDDELAIAMKVSCGSASSSVFIGHLQGNDRWSHLGAARNTNHRPLCTGHEHSAAPKRMIPLDRLTHSIAARSIGPTVP